MKQIAKMIPDSESKYEPLCKNQSWSLVARWESPWWLFYCFWLNLFADFSLGPGMTIAHALLAGRGTH